MGLAHKMNRREIIKKSGRVLMGVLFSTLLLFHTAETASAQDVVGVLPETHKVLLKNSQVRVLDVHVKPGEKVAMHSHPASILYYLSDAKLQITCPDGRVERRKVKAVQQLEQSGDVPFYLPPFLRYSANAFNVSAPTLVFSSNARARTLAQKSRGARMVVITSLGCGRFVFGMCVPLI
jgi:hypothetical protein